MCPGPDGCGKELELGTGNHFLKIQSSGFVGLLPMTIVEYTGDLLSIKNLLALKEAIPRTSLLKEQTFQRRKGTASLREASIEKHALMFSRKLARPREHPQGPCLFRTIDSTLCFTLPEWHPADDTAGLEPGPWGSKPSFCCWRTAVKELRQYWSWGSQWWRLAGLNKTKFSAHLH